MQSRSTSGFDTRNLTNPRFHFGSAKTTILIIIIIFSQNFSRELSLSHSSVPLKFQVITPAWERNFTWQDSSDSISCSPTCPQSWWWSSPGFHFGWTWTLFLGGLLWVSQPFSLSPQKPQVSPFEEKAASSNFSYMRNQTKHHFHLPSAQIQPNLWRDLGRNFMTRMYEPGESYEFSAIRCSCGRRFKWKWKLWLWLSEVTPTLDLWVGAHPVKMIISRDKPAFSVIFRYSGKHWVKLCEGDRCVDGWVNLSMKYELVSRSNPLLFPRFSSF